MIKQNVYAVAHLVDGYMKKTEIVGTLTRVLAYIGSTTKTETDGMRRSLARSVLDTNRDTKPFIVTIVTEDNKKHTFRVDKRPLTIGVKVK